ncbi:MAG: formyltransferase family protein [Polyangiaceae bacterium]
MRIAFAGLPLAALLLLEDGHELVYAGLCRRGALGSRRLLRRLGKTRVNLVPDFDDPRVIDRVREAKPDLLVSWFWTKRIPRAVLDIAPLGAVGVHPSLLPRHRGPDPYFWTIDSGDAVSGVTAHRLDEAYDTGAIYGQRKLPVDPSWTAWTLAKKLDRPSLGLLREVVFAFASSRAPAPLAQDEALATSAPEPSEEDLTLRFNDDAAHVERRVRAASPWPGTMTDIGDEPVVITRVRVTHAFPKALHPGEAAVVDGRAVVRTRDGAVELLAGRREIEGSDDEEELGPDDFARLVARA